MPYLRSFNLIVSTQSGFRSKLLANHSALFSIIINEIILIADDATFYASASNLTDVQVQLQRDLSNTATWTKDHGMAAHPQKTKYMIIGTRQKLSRCEESVLSLCLDGRQLEQTQEERLLGLDMDPSLSWSSHVATLRKKTPKARCCSGSHQKIPAG